MTDGLARRVVQIGLCIAFCGAVFNQLTGYFEAVLSKFSAVTFWSIASLCILLIGLLVAFLGGVIWALTENRLISLLLWGLSVALAGFLIAEVFDVRLLSRTVILLSFFYAAEATSAFILVIAAVRFVWGRLVTRD
jgi:hypothetical protein